MKKLLLILIVALILTLSACASVDISYKLNNNNCISVNYNVDLSDVEEDTFAYLLKIEDYWQSQGIDSYTDKEDGIVRGELTKQHNTALEAAAAFAEIVTLENNMFYDVIFEYTPSFEKDAYSFSAKISLVDVIRQTQVQDIPASRVNSVQQSALSGSYTLSVELPGEVIDTNADSIEGSICNWSLTYGDTTHIYLQTENINFSNLDYRASLYQRNDKNQLLLNISIAVAAVSLIAVIISLIIKRARRKRASEVRVKKFR